MPEDRIHADQIPEADLLEQQTPLIPPSLIDDESASVIADSADGLVDEADWLEQQTPVPGEAEDDYPRGPAGTGWS